MPKSEGYKNLILGRRWNKGKGNKVKCVVCGKPIKRSKSLIKSENSFCSLNCKGKGMTLGLCKPMRLGTGCSDKIKYFKRKYYKYRMFDKRHKLISTDYDVWDLVNRLSKGFCIYCGSKEDLGLDRINNNLGHTKYNTVISCELCNMTRGDRFTIEEMKLIGKIISKIRKLRGDVNGI
jgi:hypothetical protein